jgi:hydroxymethylpyrimidine/phosphomethylpyrimidine kinase
MKAVLAIAGLDSSGGAGLAQDVATISGIGLHPKVAATAMTAQSLAVVHAVTLLAPELVQQQICAAFEDLVPSAVKIGMLGTGKIAAAVAKSLDELHAQNIVVDPVLASTTGALLLEKGAQDALFSLFRLAAVMTPKRA